MPSMAACMAARARGLMPSGFSLEASLTILSTGRPISRASWVIGLPGW
jgi:hypothetical protein